MEHTMTPHPIPDADAVARVQAATGMDYLQAYRHEQGRQMVLARQRDIERARFADCLRAQRDAQRGQP